MNIEQQRTEFESWARANCLETDRHPEDPGYNDICTLYAWEGWQAAIASVRAQPQVELTDEEIDKLYLKHDEIIAFARAVLTAQRAKDKGAV